MKTLTLSATYDGKHIQLDEPHNLKPNTRLLVTVLPNELESERDDWIRFSLADLARAYSEDEPEYTLDMIKEPNPDYQPNR